MIATLIVAATLATASVAPSPPASATAAATAAPALTTVPALTTAPAVTAAPAFTTAPAVTAAPAFTTAPAVTTATPIAYAYRFVPYPPKDPAAPRVFAVYLNDKVLHALGPIDIRIDTSPDVVRVVEHTGKRSYPIPMTAPGRFVSNATLPKVPFIAHGIEVKLDFEAFDATGKSTSVQVPFQLK